MAKNNIVELSKFEFANVEEDGTMPTTGFTILYGMKRGSVNFNIGEPSTTSFYIEEATLPIGNSEEDREADFTVEIVVAESSVLAELLGATYAVATGADPEKLSFPPNAVPVYKAIRLTGANGDGLPVRYDIPKARILSSNTGTIGRGDMRGWVLRPKIEIPVNGSGVAQNYLYVYTGNVSA
jgi:hypothetical protein